jgi:hypothetical protein
MNPMRLSKVFKSCAACAAVLGAISTSGLSPVRAEDDQPSFDQKIMRDIMDGLGFKRDGEAGINYQERAPLVLPPSSSELPPPERTDAATSNPAWPKDPDVQRRKVEAARERNRNISDEREREQNPLRPDQLTPGGRGKSKSASRDDGYQNPASGFGSQVRPSELGYTGGIFGMFKNDKKEEQARFTGEPPRSSLTAPPAGYQTPSPDQPYGLAKGGAPAKAYDDYLNRGDLSRNR